MLDDVTMSVPRAATHFAVIPPAADEEIADALPTILATLAAAVPPREGRPHMSQPGPQSTNEGSQQQ